MNSILSKSNILKPIAESLLDMYDKDFDSKGSFNFSDHSGTIREFSNLALDIINDALNTEKNLTNKRYFF